MRLKEEFSKYCFHGYPHDIKKEEKKKEERPKLTYLLLFSEIEPWTFEQHVGEAVIIPAGCPYQIRSAKVITYATSYLFYNLVKYFEMWQTFYLFLFFKSVHVTL